jgi:hypothetical protein
MQTVCVVLVKGRVFNQTSCQSQQKILQLISLFLKKFGAATAVYRWLQYSTAVTLAKMVVAV